MIGIAVEKALSISVVLATVYTSITVTHQITHQFLKDLRSAIPSGVAVE